MYRNEWDTEEADFQQAELERLGRLSARLMKQGICTHGWRQGDGKGNATCLHCHKFASLETLDDERRDALI